MADIVKELDELLMKSKIGFRKIGLYEDLLGKDQRVKVEKDGKVIRVYLDENNNLSIYLSYESTNLEITAQGFDDYGLIEFRPMQFELTR